MTTTPIADAVHAQHARLPFTGVVHVATPDTTLVAEAFGMADRANKRPNTVDTRFPTASGTKIFTAVAVASLVDAGKLAFDACLTDLIDADLPHFDPAITVEQLLTHTAGNPDYFDEEFEDDYAALWADRPTHTVRRPADFLPMFAHLEQKFTPGERYAYSNGGFILLGLVIEAVSGQEYTEYVQAHVFDKAGMAGSGFFALDCLPARCANGYLDEDSDQTNIFSVPVIGGADGGALTTAADMDRFWRALLDGTLLSPAIRDQMLADRVVTDDDRFHYGYGVYMAGEGESRAYSVVGEDPGVSMASAILPTSGTVMTLLCNTDSAAWEMRRVVAAALNTP
ncbi:MAG: penicillin-binding protein [Actinobacteria bacterium HGW-Actinobacteria-4]|nr:MAG: penicillin-binding protein [Actinobacteria bacterium HGW-Actinobacteria-4]